MNRKQRRSAQSQDKASPEVQMQLLQALTLHQAGKLADAKNLYKSVAFVCSRMPRHWDFWVVIEAQNGQIEEGLRLLNKSLALNPQFVDGYVNRGIALHKLKRYAEAWLIAIRRLH